jgi:hypothetical protein
MPTIEVELAIDDVSVFDAMMLTKPTIKTPSTIRVSEIQW